MAYLSPPKACTIGRRQNFFHLVLKLFLVSTTAEKSGKNFKSQRRQKIETFIFSIVKKCYTCWTCCAVFVVVGRGSTHVLLGRKMKVLSRTLLDGVHLPHIDTHKEGKTT
jgi:hypothetical protein